MSTAVKWIGGATLAVLAGFTVMAFAGDALVARDPAPEPAGWIAPDDVLAEDATVTSVEPAAVDPDAADPFVGERPPVPEMDTSPFVIKRVLPIEGPIRYGEWHWDDEGVPPGPLVITVDLQARVISVFRNGYEIGAAAAMLGTDEHPTPVGQFPILTKERHNVSEKYGNAPMPWTLRLTWDGIAIHGGSEVERGYASHGCVGVPDEFADRLFRTASVGDRVIITDGVRTGVGGRLG
ncbi:L,D-transpeptidase family protein [Alteraurantiacibacter buctensis]|uniref:L,D-transpeptidase family protein n=1 Tax=Alteraurantiacibacter buctensis TaxID=1503981 RepID=A0A844Z603_9SPHN|nr:L,D-transpeptidase family protein [Alteraurantiacibacter buctensis]MXO73233.1 L,D-transpeptidase family protein [Alteraurantiacibacter buctensis]